MHYFKYRLKGKDGVIHEVVDREGIAHEGPFIELFDKLKEQGPVKLLLPIELVKNAA